MATLFEQLQSRLANTKAAPAQPQQSLVAQQIRSRTGKAGPATGVQQSNLGEQVAIGQAQQQAQAQTAQGTQAAQQLGEQQAGIQQQEQLQTEALATQRGIAESDLATKGRVQRGEQALTEQLRTEQRDAATYNQLNQMTQKYDQFLQKLATDRQLTTDKMFGQYSREQAKLELDKKESKLNQELFALTMSNKKYIDQINQIGTLRRLDNDQNFQKELRNTMFSQEFNRLQDEYKFLRDIDKDTRGFNEQLAQLGIDAKLDLYRTLGQQNQNSMVFGSISKGAEAYGSYKKDKKLEEQNNKD